MLHPDNIVSFFEQYGVEKDFGFFSENTDYAVYYFWRNALEAGYRARVIVGGVNSNLYPNESVTVHDPYGSVRKNNDYFGVSALALRRLWNKHGYIMIYCTELQTNCFGLHQDDILPVADRNPVGLRAAQECLWNKPIAWPIKLYDCDKESEKWNNVDEAGRLSGRNVQPLVTEYCHWKDTQSPSR
jgi:hypothetical protein